jgi:citrate lyase gamma subunit
MRDIEQKIREVDSTMAMEGMPLTDDDKEAMRTVLRGEISFNDMKARIISEYKPQRAVNE